MCRRRSRHGVCLLLHLFGILEPVLISRHFLPALVCRPRTDKVHVGAEVLAVRAGAVAGAVGAEAEVVGSEFFRAGLSPLKEVSALKTDNAFNGTRVG